ncbi:MAG: glycosyl hydrolase family 18 protein [Patescibacteria group bacterium]
MFQGRYILGLVACIVLGLGAASFFLRFFPSLLLPESPVLHTLGVRKPIVNGFLPYWLLTKATPESLRQLNKITYFGLEIDSDGTLVDKSTPQEAEPGWHKLANGDFTQIVSPLKGNSDYSLLLHQSNEASISALLSEPVVHAGNLVSAVEPLMKQHGFTDLNIDIESFRTASPEAQVRMSTFLREVKAQLNIRKLGTLTTELTVASLVKQALMNPTEIGEISDHVVLMAYDFRYTGSFTSGAVAPIGGAGEKIEYDIVKSVQLASQVIPSEKLQLGIPLYGYEWETLSYDPESPVVPGTGKTATSNRISELLKTCTDCITGRDELTGSPYLILPPNEDSAVQQIYYEDQESIQKKLDLAKQYKLGGVAFWAIGYETPELLTPIRKYVNEYELLF